MNPMFLSVPNVLIFHLLSWTLQNIQQGLYLPADMSGFRDLKVVLR